MTTLTDYWDRLRRHDWYYAFSDDGRVYRAGEAESSAICAIAKESPEHQALYDGFVAHYSDSGERPPMPPRP